MRVTTVQPDIIWENPAENRKRLAEMLLPLAGGTDLIILPEMFTTGFTMNSGEMAEPMNGDTLTWMKQQGDRLGAAVAGSIIVSEGAGYYNRLLFVKPGGDVEWYDKAHLFMMESENSHFLKGERQVIVSYLDFRINLQVCYDLRFPVWSRCVDNNYDLLVYVASWPGVRNSVWKSLLVARAIENQCYVAGSNRIGNDGEGITYTGDSVILGPKGDILGGIEPETEGFVTAEVSKVELDSFRQKFPVWRDADRFTIHK